MVRRFRPSVIVVVGLHSDASPSEISVSPGILRMMSQSAHVINSCHLCMISHQVPSGELLDLLPVVQDLIFQL